MKSKLILFLFAALTLTIYSCGGSAATSKEDTLKNIPQNVSMVTSIDADEILKKADFESVKNMEFYQKMIDETKQFNSTLAEVLVDPSASGVDLSKNIYIAHQVDSENPEDVFVAIIASVKDKSALEKLIQTNSDLKMADQANFKVGTSGSQSVAWNDEMVLLGMTNSYNDPMMNIQKFFEGNAESSISNDKDLQKALAGNHDISSWASSNTIAKNPSFNAMLPFIGISPEALKDNFIHSSVDFNKGAIESRSNMYLQSGLTDKIDLLFKDKLTTDFSKQIPSDANSVMTVSFDLEGIQTLLQQTNALGMANSQLSSFGLTVEDIASTLNGDMLVYSTPGSKDGQITTFAAKLNSKDKLDKLTD